MLMGSVHIKHSDCLWHIDENGRFRKLISLLVKGQGQIYLKSVLRLTTRAKLSFFVEGVHILYNGCLWCLFSNCTPDLRNHIKLDILHKTSLSSHPFVTSI